MANIQSTLYWDSSFLKAVKGSVEMYSREAEKRSFYTSLFNVEDTDEWTETFISSEQSNQAGFVPEGAAIPLSDYSKGYRVSFTPQKVAQTIQVTHEMQLKIKDNTEKAAKIVDAEVRASMNAIRAQIELRAHAYLNNGFTNTFAVAPDGLSLFNAAHQFQSGSTFDNLLAAAAPSTAVLDEVERRAGAFLAPNGDPMPFNVNKVICKKGGSASREWRKILGYNNNQYKPTTLGNINIYQGAAYELVESPYISSSTAYFFVSDYEMAGLKNPLYLGYSERPTINDNFEKDPRTLSMFTTIVSTYKDGIAYLPVGLYGSVGA